MCPFVALLIILQIFTFIFDVTSVKITFTPSNKIKIIKGQEKTINYTISDLVKTEHSSIKFIINDENIADIYPDHQDLYQLTEYKDKLTIKAKNFGYSKLNVIYKPENGEEILLQDKGKEYEIITKLNQNVLLQKIFQGSVAVLVGLNTINMGCALNIDSVKKSLKSPVTLLVGFFTHYIIMPMLSFFLGQIFFNDIPYLRLALFIFGCSPSGSGANMWTVLLDGNLNLSITMTFLSTSFAVIMMPIWLFTLGLHIFESNKLQIPFANIIGSLFGMVFCIALGLLIQRYRPKLAQKSKRILAPICGFLIAFVVIFASICYWQLFQLMTVNIFLASALNVWLGFLFGILFSFIFRRSIDDLISITLETGIVNSGIAFVIITFALESPMQDFAMTVPVASSVVTAIPLTIAFIIKKCRNKSKDVLSDDELEPVRIKNGNFS